MTRIGAIVLGSAGTLPLATVALAEDGVSPGQFTANNVWMMLCAGLVFIMHLGFAAVESGLTRARSSTNILFKNTLVICVGILTYAFCGFNLMYPGEFSLGGAFGFAGFGLTAGPDDNTVAYADGGYTYWTDFLFQAMFAATAATIVSGAVAERIKLSSFAIFAAFFVALVYPVAGSWKWGGGWLDGLGFYDFAGSTLVHSVGGWAALVGAIMLGPRLGKYDSSGRMKPLPASNLPMVTVGVFLLWLGWFGFNGGSVLSADPELTSLTLVTTCLAAAAGCVVAMVASTLAASKPDLSMSLNGILAGLVGITAGADVMLPHTAVLIGAVSGALVVGSVLLLDRLRIDDPVGAVSVHLTCGVWGTLAVGIFSTNPEHGLGAQLIGVMAYGLFTVVSAGLVFGVIRLTLGLRVPVEMEEQGLDIGEHGMHAYELGEFIGGSQPAPAEAAPRAAVASELVPKAT